MMASAASGLPTALELSAMALRLAGSDASASILSASNLPLRPDSRIISAASASAENLETSRQQETDVLVKFATDELGGQITEK